MTEKELLTRKLMDSPGLITQYSTTESFRDEADWLLANGVRIPVLCKDCKHWHENIGQCDKHSHFVDSEEQFCHPYESSNWKMFDPDYFCKDGERKSNE